MSDSTYTGKYGALKALSTLMLSQKGIEQLVGKDTDDMMKTLSETDYKSEIDSLSGLYKMPDLIEAVLNLKFSRRVNKAYAAMPPTARPFVEAYIRKFDIENIKALLSAKALGYSISQTGEFFVLSGNPIGVLAGSIGAHEYARMMELKDVETVVNHLARFGYGTALMSHIDDYIKTKSLSSMMLELDLYYYSRLLETLKFYKGDEGTVYGYVTALIDSKNIVVAAKSRYIDPAAEPLLIPGGKLSKQQVIDAVSGKDVRFPGLPDSQGLADAIHKYFEKGMASDLELYFRRALYDKYMPLFASFTASLPFMLGYIIRAETERNSLRSIFLTRYYGIDSASANRFVMGTNAS
ncbi:V-type ATPase subunit [Candidatus Marsarchaeota archaeon]|nr:V-type ATPase subunit [Candidatus Marsarchaeota archaeon]MCL5404347.1 V-type ATPase subunit [Candidatus Marsarchaeota archaeon]